MTRSYADNGKSLDSRESPDLEDGSVLNRLLPRNLSLGRAVLTSFLQLGLWAPDLASFPVSRGQIADLIETSQCSNPTKLGCQPQTRCVECEYCHSKAKRSRLSRHVSTRCERKQLKVRPRATVSLLTICASLLHASLPVAFPRYSNGKRAAGGAPNAAPQLTTPYLVFS